MKPIERDPRAATIRSSVAQGRREYYRPAERVEPRRLRIGGLYEVLGRDQVLRIASRHYRDVSAGILVVGDKCASCARRCRPVETECRWCREWGETAEREGVDAADVFYAAAFVR